MSRWPHAPCHIFNSNGSYMITASTLHKEHLFKTGLELDLLQKHLFELAEKYEWRLEAWALFSNHYHVIMQAPKDPTTLRRFITHLHASTAKELNIIHNCKERTVWFEYWDSQLTYLKSYFARLKYVMQNPVKHGIVDRAENYPWCSAHWFSQNAQVSHQKVVASFKTDSLKICDDF